MSEAATFHLSDHLPLDNIAVQKSMPTNNIHNKYEGDIQGNCQALVTRNIFSESDAKKKKIKKLTHNDIETNFWASAIIKQYFPNMPC